MLKLIKKKNNYHYIIYIYISRIYEKNIKFQILTKNIECYRKNLGKFGLYLKFYFLSVHKPCIFFPAILVIIFFFAKDLVMLFIHF